MSIYRQLLRWPEDPNKKRVLLFDGHALAYRSFYAISDLSTRDGRPINALFGFWRVFSALMRTFPSAYAAVAFDAGGKTFRHEIYPDYKATRKEMPEALASQLPLIQELLRLFGVHVFAEEGVEADDILASAARRVAEQGLTAYIVTSDKDLAQLVDDRIALVRPTGRRPDGSVEVFDVEKVSEKFGVSPEQIVDLYALVGDTSDNIPGVPSVGEKTAVHLLTQFGSLDAIFANVAQVKNKRVRENLETHAALALRARELITLKTDVPIGDVPKDCRLLDVDRDGMVAFLEDVEFHSVLKELGLSGTGGRAKTPRAKKGRYRTILRRKELDRLVSTLAQNEAFSLDLETTSRDPMRAEIVGIALSPVPGEGAYIPVAHDYLGIPEQLSLDEVFEALRPLIEATSPGIVGQNLKYDVLVLNRYGLHPAGLSFDAMIASHLARPQERRHNLEEIARFYLGYEMLSYEAVAGKDGEMAAVPLEEATFYAGEDADIAFRVKEPLEAALNEMGELTLLRDVEMPLIPVLARMEHNGVLIDQQVLAAQGRELKERLGIIEADLYEMAGEHFNPSSPKQVAEILFERLGLPVLERTKTGPSTSARVLSNLAVQHPLPGKLIDYRELEKLLNTYIERLPEAIHPETGRIHTSFHQTSTATGRLSSSDPNLQNIPIRTEVGERIRQAFVAPEGACLIGADYSQIELRLLAHFSEDRALIEAFESGRDLHRMTASRIFAVAEEAMTPQLRDAAKRVNFGIIYGISPFGLARELGISQSEAKAYIDRFFLAYPNAKGWIDVMVERATSCGYAETILGRRRPLTHLTSKNVARRNFDRRNAVNTPIQGSAADLIKLAMLEIDRAIQEERLNAKMLLQVHDELIFEVVEKNCEPALAQIKEMMEDVMELRVPLAVEVKHGKNWSEI
jgi:DNA polymerase-1